MINLILKTLWPFKITIHSVANVQQINMLSIHFDRFWHMNGLETCYNQYNKDIHYSELSRILCKTVLLPPNPYWCVSNNLFHCWLLLRQILLLPTRRFIFICISQDVWTVASVAEKSPIIQGTTIYLSISLVVEMLAVSKLWMLQIRNIYWDVFRHSLVLSKRLGMNWLA